MKRVLKVIVPIGVVVGIAVPFVRPWGGGPHGAPPGAWWDDAAGGFVGHVAHITSNARLLDTSPIATAQLVIIDSSYDRLGRCTKTVITPPSLKRDYEYNRRGELMLVRTRVPNSTDVTREEFSYSPAARILVERDYRSGSPSRPAKQNWLGWIRELFSREDGETCYGYVESKLNVHNQIVEGTVYNEEGRPEVIFTLVRDQSGRVVARNHGGHEIRYTRNSRGDVVEQKSSAGFGLPPDHRLKMTYDYDSKGNWICRTETSYAKGKWKPFRLTKRKITYYK